VDRFRIDGRFIRLDFLGLLFCLLGLTISMVKLKYVLNMFLVCGSFAVLRFWCAVVPSS
jgi:hypothetical protein